MIPVHAAVNLVKHNPVDTASYVGAIAIDYFMPLDTVIKLLIGLVVLLRFTIQLVKEYKQLKRAEEDIKHSLEEDVEIVRDAMEIINGEKEFFLSKYPEKAQSFDIASKLLKEKYDRVLVDLQKQIGKPKK